MQRHRLGVLIALLSLACGLFVFTGAALADPSGTNPGDIDTTDIEAALESGALQFNSTDTGSTALTQCPQAGRVDLQPRPTQPRKQDALEQYSNQGNDRRANQDFSCSPQNETTISVNPNDGTNVVGGANDYRIGTGYSGFYASTDNGTHWYDGLQQVPSQANTDIFDAGGDPAVTFDSDGVAYYAGLGFNRTNGSSGVFVARSGNGGFTWSRPRQGGAAPSPRLAGDGVVDYQDGLTGCSASTGYCTLGTTAYAVDKEYIAAGPRPFAVSPQCYDANHAPIPCDAAHPVSNDRLYVSWTRFENNGSAIVFLSHSDDQARSWSPAVAVANNAPFCGYGPGGTGACDEETGSDPTVSADGTVYVGYENFNTFAENQYFVSKSVDGGATFGAPSYVTPVFDINFPTSGGNRPDCTPRGQQGGRSVLTNSCFRVDSYGNVVADKRPGFSNDVYLVMDDNRNGTRSSSNDDVFFFRSTDAGATWVGPTRVNNDASTQPLRANGTSLRNCGFVISVCPTGTPNYGNDNFFPWMDIDKSGNILIGFEDRRLDTTSTASEWPTSRARAGNYLVWFFGGTCQVTKPTGSECVSSSATTAVPPTGPTTGFNNTVFPDQTDFPFQNIQISDTASNFDDAFGGGVFAGDYSGVAAQDGTGYALWTDARNGRGSNSPGSGLEAGRNPACEQSDVFFDSFSLKGNGSQPKASANDLGFAQAACPIDNIDKGHGGNGKG